MSYLYDGDKKKELKIPPMSLFTENQYMKYQPDLFVDIPDRIVENMKEVLSFNGSKSTEPTRKDNRYHTSANSVLFNIRSYINHNRKQNIKMEYPSSNVMFIFASHNIGKGEEIFIDYVDGIEDLNARNMALAKYHINELNERGQTEPLDLPEEYDDNDHRYVDPERIVRERIAKDADISTVATGTAMF